MITNTYLGPSIKLCIQHCLHSSIAFLGIFARKTLSGRNHLSNTLSHTKHIVTLVKTDDLTVPTHFPKLFSTLFQY